MQVDEQKVRKITGELLSAVDALERLGRLSEPVFRADPDKVASAKYNFIVAIEAAIDLCNHAIARNSLRSPEDYADSFRVLAEAGAYDSTFAGRLAPMARFRNRLVHIYWEVDNRELYRYMHECLGDLREFLKKFGAFVGSREAK